MTANLKTEASVWRPSLNEGLSHPHLPGLDGLRMVAVFLVVFYHFGFTAVPGGHGVLVFFVISGFLITWLLLKEEDKHGSISLRHFYLRRALRIFPAFYCFWLLWTAALLVMHKPIVWGQSISALAYVNNYYQAIFGDPNTGYSHTWSLGIEEQFYLMWPLSMIALRKRSRMWGLVIAIGAIWIHRAVLQLAVNVHQGYFYEAFDTRADHLLTGCLLAVMLHEGHMERAWKWICTPWMSVAALAILAASVWTASIAGTEYRNLVGFAIDPLLVAILVVQIIALRKCPLWCWLNWRWVRYLGLISYSIYLYQQVVIDPVTGVMRAYPLPVKLVVVVGATVLVASASYHLIEMPLLKLKDRIGARKDAAASEKDLLVMPARIPLKSATARPHTTSPGQLGIESHVQ